MSHDYDKPIIPSDTTGRVKKPEMAPSEHKKTNIKVSFENVKKQNLNAFEGLLPLTANVRKAQGNSPNKPTIPEAQTMEGG